MATELHTVVDIDAAKAVILDAIKLPDPEKMALALIAEGMVLEKKLLASAN